MGKFDEELTKATNPWIIQIGKYLSSRDDMQENLKKENKSLDECFRYVLNEIANKYRKNNEKKLWVYGQDEEIYALAVHYYDEDDIEVPKTLPFVTNADGSVKKRISQSSKKKDTESITKKQTDSDKTKAQPKKKKPKKDKKVDENQLSLFNYLG